MALPFFGFVGPLVRHGLLFVINRMHKHDSIWQAVSNLRRGSKVTSLVVRSSFFKKTAVGGKKAEL
jgi:hypothetical protein